MAAQINKRALLRILPAALAAYEFRYLIGHLTTFVAALQPAGSRSITLFAVLLLGAAGAVFLRESGRGVVARVPRPGWSPRFVGLWMLCSAVVAGLLVGAGLFHVLPGIGSEQQLLHSVVAWSAVPTGLLLGLLLAASVYGARRLLLELVRPCRRPGDFRAPPLAQRADTADRRPAVAPLRAGWSDRGPPVGSPLVAF